MKKALQVASVASMIEQFNRENIKILQELGHKVDVAANFKFGSTISQEKVNKLRSDLNRKEVEVFNIEFDRNIFSKKNINAYCQMKKILKENKYEIIHCHSPIAGVITRLAAIRTRKEGTKVIYTAHGFHFFKGAPIKNWILYYPVELISSIFTDTLITINTEDYEFAKKRLLSKETKYVKGIGIDVDYLQSIKVNPNKRAEIAIEDEDFLLISVGEVNDNKNHIVVIKAVEKLLKEKNLSNIKYIIVGKGHKQEELQEYIKKNNLENNIKFLGFRDDVLELVKIANCFVFPSKREGLSKALMEAIAIGTSVIASDIRGNRDLVKKGTGSLFEVSQYKDLQENIYKEYKINYQKEYSNIKNKEIIQISREQINKSMKLIYI